MIAEVIFVFMVVYAAYVVQVMFLAHKKPEVQRAVKEKVIKTTTPGVAPVAQQVQPVPEVKSKVIPQSTPKIKTASKPGNKKSTLVIKLPTGQVRHPETGEVAKLASSYRMTKRWIKEALVSEGLLDKIYKINELDDASSAKISHALQQLKAMPKYAAD